MKRAHAPWLSVGLLTVAFSRAPQALAAAPQAILHKVAERGETYGLLADHYYGSRYLAHHLSAANRYQEPLKPGVTLIIPTHRQVQLRNVGELEEFARRHLSRASRAAYLRKLHQLGDSETNRPLIVPPALRHRVRPGESLKAIARTYYRDTSPRRRELIRLYNDLPSEVVRPGSVLRIPLDTSTFAHSRVLGRSRVPLAKTMQSSSFEDTASAEDPDGSTEEAVRLEDTASAGTKAARSTSSLRERRAQPIKKTRPGAARAASSKTKPRKVRWGPRVERVERHYADGDYARALEESYSVLRAGERIPGEYRIQLLSLAASALVALARMDEAENRFRELLELDPNYEPDAYRTSPKILDVFEAAKRAATAPGVSRGLSAPDTNAE